MSPVVTGPFAVNSGHFRARGRLGLFAALFFFYLLTSSRERPWGDARPIWDVAEALVNRAELNIGTRWPPSLPLGQDGKIYAAAPIFQSVVQGPAAALQKWVSARWPEKAVLYWPLSCHLASAALGAMTCVLFFGLCLRLGLRAPPSAFAALLLALSTTIWVYARYPYSE